MIRVLVGKRNEEGHFTGYWAEFEGEEVASYEKEDDLVYTLYKATEATPYTDDAYRVHISDETNPQSPKYELHPLSGDPFVEGAGSAYAEPYPWEEVVDKYPLFVKRAAEKDKRLDHFHIVPADSQRWPP